MFLFVLRLSSWLLWHNYGKTCDLKNVLWFRSKIRCMLFDLLCRNIMLVCRCNILYLLRWIFFGDNSSEKTNICLVNFLRYRALVTNEFSLKKCVEDLILILVCNNSCHRCLCSESFYCFEACHKISVTLFIQLMNESEVDGAEIRPCWINMVFVAYITSIYV
jgi:hypothetical protein